MTASEISSRFHDLEADRDHYKNISDTLHSLLKEHLIMFRCDCDDLYCKEMRVYLDTMKSPAIKESVEAVVEMMNSGNVDPKAVYPRGNRYHGD